jgi:peptidoglycan hydrolase-like protein with peptidoglycan-binding domain
MRGPDVKRVQQVLALAGFLHETADGIYGPVTWAAVAAFQARYGLDATGVIDPETWGLLEGLLEEIDIEGTTAPGPEGDTEAATRPAPLGYVSILIDTNSLTITVFSDEQIWGQFPIAAGKPSTPTPLGEWRVVSKARWAEGFGTRWMGISVPFATYGIHGTSNPGSIGTASSHGCIRMYNRHVETVFAWVSLGTPAKITGHPRTHFGELPRLIRPGYVGSDVMLLQQRLKELGLYSQRIDGRFGAGTVRALREFQWARFLPVTGIADQATRAALGMP